jgi:branched-chain amino acid transport system ATP-binding protein
MLEVSNLVCGYGLVTAVDGASFSVRAGEILALLGPNGAGKSSTIMAIAGHTKVKAGRISLDGNDISALAPGQRTRRGIGLVPEGRRVFADLSVAENLLVGGYVQPVERARQSLGRVIELFPRLGERLQQRSGTLSGGEQQMLAIGRALMAEPRLLLVDELSLGLMPAIVDTCIAVIETLRRDGVAIVLVEQNTQKALAIADNVVVLNSGVVAYDGDGESARRDPKLVESMLAITSDK